MIYLDNAATTYPKPDELYVALNNANKLFAFNAGRGAYNAAKETALMINEARAAVADFVSLSADTVSFESSATEALNIIINGISFNSGDTVYISPFEHNAVIRPLYNIKKDIDINIEVIPFDKKTWELDIKKLSDMFALKKPKAVFATHVSNVVGYILPYNKIFELSKKYNAINVLDSAQSFGVLNPIINDVDFIVFAGHKSLYASFGVAGFINVNNEVLKVTKSGGTGSDSLNHDMPTMGNTRYEAGSHNSVAIAGLLESTKWLKKSDIYKKEKELTDYLINELKKISKIKVYLPCDMNQVFGVISFTVSGYSPSDIGSILNDEFDICVRTGYHCSPLIHDFIGTTDSYGTVRISLGAFNNKNDIDSLIDALETL